VAYDFKDIYMQEKIIESSDFSDSETFGEDTPFGTGTPFGGSGNLYQIRVNFAKQKCSSIKLSIEDISDTEGESLELSNIAFNVGIKNRTNTIKNVYGTI
jgi:hypothetical protein